MEYNKHNCGCAPQNAGCCEYILGNSADLHVNTKDCEVRLDLTVEKANGVRVWGQVKDCSGMPVANVLVKLVKVMHYCGRQEYVGVAHTVSDCNGFYQFDLTNCEEADYKVLVSKSAVGNERVASSSMSCNVCEPVAPPMPDCNSMYNFGCGGHKPYKPSCN
ncbi:MAG: carboxypeptidase-like regulatory domain-containing protein [Sarcina sp.]|uniref:carboxypeptidase-like regulatory domain-containing protein n=1 Tax=Clostridium sp. TaxID=1506 RepID=UPI003F3851E8